MNGVTGATQCVVDPQLARTDIRYLWPDLRRPGLALRAPTDPDVLAAPDEPAALCERIERELAGEAARYRKVLLAGTLMLVMPFAVLVLANLAADAGVPVFTRGWYLPGVAVYEAVAFAFLFGLVAWGASYVKASWDATRRLGVDYRRLRDATPERKAGYAAEASSGRWPRTLALLERGTPFQEYRDMFGNDRG